MNVARPPSAEGSDHACRAERRRTRPRAAALHFQQASSASAARRAFTLIEAMVVVLIVGLAAALVFPNLTGGAVGRARLRASARKLASLAAYLRDQAVIARKTYLLRVDLRKGEYWATARTSRGERTPASGPAASRFRLSEGVRFLGAQAPGTEGLLHDVATLRFTPEGAADNAAIYLAAAGDEVCTVVVARGGRALVCDSRVEVGADGRIVGGEED